MANAERRGARAQRTRRGRATLAGGVLAMALAAVLTACCPATGPAPTAFTARLRGLGGGEALARLADGRQVRLTGLSRVPPGPVYVTGHLLPDGRVAVDSVRRLTADGGTGR